MNALFSIYDGRQKFYQWDADRKLIVDDNTINQVHFCNRTDECSLVCEVYDLDGKRVVNVPNILLQTDWRINVYGYDKNYTKHNEVFEVVRRSKPADYVYTETEVLNYNTLLERLDAISEDIEDVVREYLDENPIEVDLSEYATKEELEAIELTPGPVGPQGEPGKDGADGKTPIKGVDYFDGADGKDYVLTEEDKAEIAGMVDVSGGDVDLTDYYTKTEVDNKIPDVSGFQTEAQVIALINEYASGETLPASEEVKF